MAECPHCMGTEKSHFSYCRDFVAAATEAAVLTETKIAREIIRHTPRFSDLSDDQISALLSGVEAALRIRGNAIRGIVNHWNEFSEMMGVKDDYGFSERLDAAEKLIR
jgi:hypothetical protein